MLWKNNNKWEATAQINHYVYVRGAQQRRYLKTVAETHIFRVIQY